MRARTMHCHYCQRVLQLDAEYCDRCGRQVVPPADDEGEHRWVTIMFCDLVGSAALSDQLEAEDMRSVLRAYQSACKAVVERHGGTIGRYVGDGLLVYFGYPEAHEDAPQRAARGALGIVEAVSALAVEAAGLRIQLQVRIGVETGSVLIGHIDRSASLERDAAVGSLPNVAARLQTLARPNGIVVGEVTRRHLGSGFECRSNGEVTLKGIARPVCVHEVLAETGGAERAAWATTRAMAPLVERDTQQERLRAAWHQVKQSHPGVVFISGEAGVGKSRLVHTLLDELNGENVRQIVYHCAAQHQGSPLYPVVAQLQQFFGLDPGASGEDRRCAFLEGAKRLCLSPSATAALASLAGVAPDPLEAPTTPAPIDLRRNILAALGAMVSACARQAPTLMLVEDLHWCDPSTEEFLAALCSQTLPARLLLVITHRPQVEPAWATAAGPQSIALERLSSAASRDLVQALLAGHSVPTKLVDRVVDRSEGIPLFLEEFARLLTDVDASGQAFNGRDFAGMTIPDSLQASLAARLDRIGPLRRVAQVAAAFGRSFSRAQLMSMPDLSETDIDLALRGLARKGVLVAASQASGQPAEEHEFSHALVRDAAYQSMPREDRQAVHRRIAERLELDFPEVAAARPELVAHHFTEAKARDRAIGYWFLAGQKAMERLAHVETIEHLRRGLAMLDAVQEAERTTLELRFQTALMPALCATRGYANPEVEQSFSRAHDLCKQLGANPALSAVLYGLWVYYLVRADLVRSRRLAREMKGIADRTGDALQRMESELAAGVTSMYIGDLGAAASHLHRILEVWTPEGPQFFATGEDIRASTKSWLGIVYWHQGDIDRAKQVAQESLYRARQLGQPISLAFALYFNVFLAQFCRDIAGVRRLGQEGLQLCQEHRLFWGTLCVLQLGWALADDRDAGDVAAGTAEMAHGLSGFRLAGARLTQTYYLSMIAQARLVAGDLAGCEGLLTEAVAAAEETGEQLWCSELLRLRGELALKLGTEGSALDPGQADATEGLFRSALAHAQAVGAASLALRSAHGLARCLALRQQPDEASALLDAALAPIRSVVATPDIEDARRLLASLRQPVHGGHG